MISLALDNEEPSSVTWRSVSAASISSSGWLLLPFKSGWGSLFCCWTCIYSRIIWSVSISMFIYLCLFIYVYLSMFIYLCLFIYVYLFFLWSIQINTNASVCNDFRPSESRSVAWWENYWWGILIWDLYSVLRLVSWSGTCGLTPWFETWELGNLFTDRGKHVLRLGTCALVVTGSSVPWWVICALVGHLCPGGYWFICALVGHLCPGGSSVPWWVMCALVVTGSSVPWWVICALVGHLCPGGSSVPWWVICALVGHLCPGGRPVPCW